MTPCPAASVTAESGPLDPSTSRTLIMALKEELGYLAGAHRPPGNPTGEGELGGVSGQDWDPGWSTPVYHPPFLPSQLAFVVQEYLEGQGESSGQNRFCSCLLTMNVHQ